MRNLSTFLIVAALSGVPATAVVCDLLLCAGQAAAPVQGCHDHGGSGAGDVISAAADECTHLAPASPFVAPAAPQTRERGLVAGTAAAPVPMSADSRPFARLTASVGPPRAPAHAAVVLRI